MYRLEGALPSLRFRLSPEKGKTLMRIIRMVTGADKKVSTQKGVCLKGIKRGVYTLGKCKGD